MKIASALTLSIVAVGANNHLAYYLHGDALHDRVFVYAPDYLINVGGLINVYS